MPKTCFLDESIFAFVDFLVFLLVEAVFFLAILYFTHIDNLVGPFDDDVDLYGRCGLSAAP